MRSNRVRAAVLASVVGVASLLIVPSAVGASTAPSEEKLECRLTKRERAEFRRVVELGRQDGLDAAADDDGPSPDDLSPQDGNGGDLVLTASPNGSNLDRLAFCLQAHIDTSAASAAVLWAREVWLICMADPTRGQGGMNPGACSAELTAYNSAYSRYLQYLWAYLSVCYGFEL